MRSPAAVRASRARKYSRARNMTNHPFISPPEAVCSADLFRELPTLARATRRHRIPTSPRAMATPPPRKDPPLLGKDLPPGVEKRLPGAFTRTASPPGQKKPFQITDETEVLLDGRPCPYRDVPANAGILSLEVGPDNRTV